MRILVYAHRSQSDQADSIVRRLRGEGHSAVFRDTRGFDGDVERCDRVVTDDPAVRRAHEARGIEVVPFTARQTVEVPTDIPGRVEETDGDPGEGEQEGGFDGEDETAPVKQRRTRRRRG